jgi:hypothetical protein
MGQVLLTKLATSAGHADSGAEAHKGLSRGIVGPRLCELHVSYSVL